MTSASPPTAISDTSFTFLQSTTALTAGLLQLVPTALTALLLAGIAVLLLLPQVAGNAGHQTPPVQPSVLQPARSETPDANTFTLYLLDSEETAAELQEALAWYALHIAPSSRGYDVTFSAAGTDPAPLVSETWQRFQRSDVRFVVVDLRGR
jgi:hypothetical protein